MARTLWPADQDPRSGFGEVVRKKRRAARAGKCVLACLAAGIGGLCLLLLLTSPAQRSIGYVTANKLWFDNWPLSRGKFAPEVAAPILCGLGFLGPVRLTVEPGVSLYLDPRDLISRHLLLRGAWEPDGLVVAIEPNPIVARQLRENIRASGATKTVVEELACSERDGSLDRFVSGPGNSGESSLSQENAADSGASSGSYKVQARPLDSILDGIGIKPVDVVKVDVEGAELVVLKGSLRTIDRYHPVLLVEMIDPLLKNMNTSVAEVTRLLESLGYRNGREVYFTGTILSWVCFCSLLTLFRVTKRWLIRSGTTTSPIVRYRVPLCTGLNTEADLD